MKKSTIWIAAAYLAVCLFFVEATPAAYATEPSLTRGEASQLLVDAFDLEYNSDMTIPFADVPETSPYYEAICICCHVGLMDGYSDNTFKSNNSITRSGLATLLYRGGLPLDYPDTIPSDVSSDSVAYGAICSMLALEIMSVDENGKFNPNKPACRSDVNLANIPDIDELLGPTTTAAANLDLANGSISIGRNIKGVTVFRQGETEIRTSAGAGIIRQTDNATATTNTISVENGSVSLTVSGLNVATTSSAPVSVEKGAALTLTLVDQNRFVARAGYSAGIQVSEGATLTVTGTGSVDATGGAGNGRYGGGAGIGDGGTVIINGGTVTATGGGDSEGGAGIGGSCSGAGGIVIINGGTVTATGADGGAGIGGGCFGDGDTVIINDGSVTATGGNEGAGIGGGARSNGGIVTINGGIVTATGGDNGAGIGGGHSSDGYSGKSGDITITGGTVIATGGTDANGIGTGYRGIGGRISISGGFVTATYGPIWFPGGEKGVGIGGSGCTVSISNAEVSASGHYFAIGGGYLDNQYGCDAITIENNATAHLTYTNLDGASCQEKIVINTQPGVSAALSGNNAKFAVDADGHSGLSYQWQVSSDTSTWTDMEGATSAVGASQPLSANNEDYYYRCKLTNGWGNVIYTNAVQAHILNFTQQPTDLKLGLNEIATLTVTSSCENVSYQWQRSYDEGITWTDVSGEMFSTLIVSTTLSENNALYRCVITAGNGDSLASDSARITVISDAVTYTTNYYCEKADGSGYELVDCVVTESTTGSAVTAPAKAYSHFIEDTTQGTHSGTVLADSSLTLSRYYDRKSYTISFEMNGGLAEADITVRYGAMVVAPPNPTRAGYVFDGWYVDEALTEAFTFSTMPGKNITVYARWTAIGEGRGIEYKIEGISLLDQNYNAISEIPKGMFYAEVSVKNLSSSTMDTLMLATYDENGRFLGLQYLRSNPPIGYTFVLGTTIDNSTGAIASIKAFMVPALGSTIPLAASAEFK